MKSRNISFARTIACTLLCLCTFASASFAATKPISFPRGLAVDAKGNLYVANSGGNDILVYTNSYAQATAKTITANVSNPTAVAIDAKGNLWVANYGTSNGGPNGSVAEYTAGKQDTASSITTGILGPNALAVDGAGNVWVVNDNVNISVYNPPVPFVTGITLAKTFAPNFPLYGLAVTGGTIAWGTNTAMNFGSTTLGLVSGTLSYNGYPNMTGFALATDASGNIYVGNLDGTVDVATSGGAYGLLQLSFAPSGIAIDNARGRVYLSNYNGNSILVYSTAGALLHTIQ